LEDTYVHPKGLFLSNFKPNQTSTTAVCPHIYYRQESGHFCSRCTNCFPIVAETDAVMELLYTFFLIPFS